MSAREELIILQHAASATYSERLASGVDSRDESWTGWLADAILASQWLKDRQADALDDAAATREFPGEQYVWLRRRASELRGSR